MAEKLKSLNLPGESRLQTLSQELADVMLTDASDAPQRLGKPESPLYASLKWATELRQALEQGLEPTLRDLRALRTVVENMPTTGAPAALKADLAEPFGLLDAQLAQSDFYRGAADLSSRLTDLRGRVREAAQAQQAAQAARLKQATIELQRVPEWMELTRQEQQELLADIDNLTLQPEHNAEGLRSLVNQEFTIQTHMQDAMARIERLGRERVQARIRIETEAPPVIEGVQEPRPHVRRQVNARSHITTIAELDSLIRELQRLRGELRYAHAFELDLRLGD